MSNWLSRTLNTWLARRNRLLVCRDEALLWRESYDDAMQGVQRAMKRIARHTEPQTIIDVGASNGCWSLRCMDVFPDSRYLLVEAQEDAHGEALQSFCCTRPNVDYIVAAASSEEGMIYFDASSPSGGKASLQPLEGDAIIKVPMTTIDKEVRTRSLPPPYLIKLDTHGHELPILEGCRDTLVQTEILVIESYNFFVSPESIRFPDLCAHLEPCGFLPFDLIDILRRPSDDCLWQFDLVFLRKNHPVFSDHSYNQST